MARYIKVSLEHHQQRRYHIVNYGRGRRPAETKYGKFNLKFRHEGKRGRQPLITLEVTAALEARSAKEKELNAAPVVERKGMLQTISDKYLADILKGRKKKTYHIKRIPWRCATSSRLSGTEN
jgi:hypothetical protein